MRLTRSVCLDAFTGLTSSFFAYFLCVLRALTVKNESFSFTAKSRSTQRRRTVQKEIEDLNYRLLADEKRNFKERV